MDFLQYSLPVDYSLFHLRSNCKKEDFILILFLIFLVESVTWFTQGIS